MHAVMFEVRPRADARNDRLGIAADLKRSRRA